MKMQGYGKTAKKGIKQTKRKYYSHYTYAQKIPQEMRIM